MSCPIHIYIKRVQTAWRPPGGIDASLRQFKCSLCGYVEYERPVGFTAMTKIKNRTAGRRGDSETQPSLPDK